MLSIRARTALAYRAEAIEQHEPCTVFIDGVGGGVVDRLIELSAAYAFRKGDIRPIA